MRTLNKIFKKDKGKFYIPSSAQDVVPIQALWQDGIFLVKDNKYSKCYKFIDMKQNVIIALKQYRLYHSNDTASLAWLQVSLFTWLAIPV